MNGLLLQRPMFCVFLSTIWTKNAEIPSWPAKFFIDFPGFFSVFYLNFSFIPAVATVLGCPLLQIFFTVPISLNHLVVLQANIPLTFSVPSFQKLSAAFQLSWCTATFLTSFLRLQISFFFKSFTPSLNMQLIAHEIQFVLVYNIQ